MNKFKYTFWFYAKEHFTKKSLIVLGIFFAATVGIAFAIDHFGDGSYTEIGIVQHSPVFVIEESLFAELPDRRFHFIDDVNEARVMLEDGTLADVFVIAGVERPELSIISSTIMPDSEMEMFLTQLLMAQQMELIVAEYELPASVVIQLSTPFPVSFETIEDEDSAIAAQLLNMVLPWMVYMLVLLSGQMVANSVASEKTSRVMEVMLGKVHPTITMLSKVLSALVGMLTPMVSMLLGVVVAHLLGFVDLELLLSLINEFISVEIIVLTLGVLILGYFCFIFFFAAAGAIANSVESLTSTLQPLVYATAMPFLLLAFLDLDSLAMNILVYVPFVSPYVIVQRFLMGHSSLAEVVIVLVLMAAFSVVALIVSARLYMNGISHTSEKVTLKDWKMLLQK